jgi:uncharacterized Tic20 family protein
METPPPSLPPLPLTAADKLLIALCHLSLFFGMAFLLPLVVFLIKNREANVVAENAREALNFHISVIIYAVVGFILIFLFIGIPLLIVLGLGSALCAIIAAMRGAEGGVYRYPLTIRLV